MGYEKTASTLWREEEDREFGDSAGLKVYFLWIFPRPLVLGIWGYTKHWPEVWDEDGQQDAPNAELVFEDRNDSNEGKLGTHVRLSQSKL